MTCYFLYFLFSVVVSETNCMINDDCIMWRIIMLQCHKALKSALLWSSLPYKYHNILWWITINYCIQPIQGPYIIMDGNTAIQFIWWARKKLIKKDTAVIFCSYLSVMQVIDRVVMNIGRRKCWGGTLRRDASLFGHIILTKPSLPA